MGGGLMAATSGGLFGTEGGRMGFRVVVELAGVARFGEFVGLCRRAAFDSAGMLQLGVELRAEEDGQVGEPQPDEEDDDARERAVGTLGGGFWRRRPRITGLGREVPSAGSPVSCGAVLVGSRLAPLTGTRRRASRQRVSRRRIPGRYSMSAR